MARIKRMWKALGELGGRLVRGPGDREYKGVAGKVVPPKELPVKPTKKAPSLELPGGKTSPDVITARVKPLAKAIEGPARLTAMDPRRTDSIIAAGGIGVPGEPTAPLPGPAPLAEGMPGEFVPPALEEAGVSPKATKGVDWNRIAFILGSAAQATMGEHQESWQARLGGFGAQLAQQDVYSTYVSDILEGKTPDPQALNILTPELRTQALREGEEAKTKRVERRIKEEKLDVEIGEIKARTEAMLTSEETIALTKEDIEAGIEEAKITAKGWIDRANIQVKEARLRYVDTSKGDESEAFKFAMQAGTTAREALSEAMFGSVTTEQLQAEFDAAFNSSWDTYMERVLGKPRKAEAPSITTTPTKEGDLPDWFREVSIGEEFEFEKKKYRKTSETDYEVVK